MATRAKTPPIFEVCATGSTGSGTRRARYHLRRCTKPDRTLCGRQVRGIQPAITTKPDCFACRKTAREAKVFRAPKEHAPVMATASSKVHLAQSNGLWPSHETLCGREVVGVLAIGVTGAVDCARCFALAKDVG